MVDGFLPDAHQSPPARRGCSVLPFLVILFLSSLAPGGALNDPVLPPAALSVSRGAPPSPSRLAAALPSSGAPESAPATSDIGTVIVGGYATWFEASGYQAAVPWWEAGQEPVLARVCSGHCILVKLTGYCACGDRHGIPTVADLSPAAFREFAPLSQGLVKVTVEWPVELPATDADRP